MNDPFNHKLALVGIIPVSSSTFVGAERREENLIWMTPCSTSSRVMARAVAAGRFPSWFGSACGALKRFSNLRFPPAFREDGRDFWPWFRPNNSFYGRECLWRSGPCRSQQPVTAHRWTTFFSPNVAHLHRSNSNQHNFDHGTRVLHAVQGLTFRFRKITSASRPCQNLLNFL